jgi:hypothetical protein
MLPLALLLVATYRYFAFTFTVNLPSPYRHLYRLSLLISRLISRQFTVTFTISLPSLLHSSLTVYFPQRSIL